MKWHIICLVVSLLLINPMGMTEQPGVAYQGWWGQWQAVVLAYGACPGRVTVCRWRLAWRRTRPRTGRRSAPGKNRSAKRVTPSSQSDHPVPSPSEVGGDRAQAAAVSESSSQASQPGSSPSKKASRVPLSLILRPGVMLTNRGIQLRPMIARLGDDVAEYRALWEDKDRFKAAIAHLLHRRCASCGGTSGFECIGSGKRSVIPPGASLRDWFRVQKIRCLDCRAITRILPTFCLPFKSHHAQTIQNALENCWRRNTSYRDTTAILDQTRPQDAQYQGHTLPYEWTIWLGGLTIHLPQLLVWLAFRLPKHGLMDEYFLEQDKGTDDHRIFAVTVQDPASTTIWNILRTDRNDTEAFKRTLQQLKAVEVNLRAITTDGWPAILRAVREELVGCIHLLCLFHAKKNVFETVEKYRRAKKLSADAPELAEWQRAFFAVLEAPDPKTYRVRLRASTKRAAHEPILLARCESLSRKIHYNTWRLRSPLLAATSSRVELTFKFLTRKIESLYSFRRSNCDAAQKSLTTWAIVRNFVPYLPGAKQAGLSPAQLAGVDLQGLPWLQYVNLKLSEVE